MSEQSVGTELLAKILQEERVQDFLTIRREYLYQDELKNYDFIKSFYDQHGTLPSVEVAGRKTKGIKPVVTKDPFGHFYAEYTSRALFNQFQTTLPVLSKHIAARNMTKAVEEISNLLDRTKAVRSDAQRDLTTLAAIGRELLGELESLRGMQGITGIPTGWPTLDKATMGLQPGSLGLILARPKMGKTITMLNMANACYDSQRIPLVVSMEMKKHPIGRRLLGKRASVSMTCFRSGQVSRWAERKLIAEVERMEHQHPFYIIDGQFRKTVEEVGSLVFGLMPSALYVDAGYLLKLINGNSQKKRHEQIEEIVQILIGILSQANIPGVVSFQYNRNIKKGATGGEFGDIQLADAIGQMAGWGLGIYEDPDTDSQLSVNRRLAEFIGGREGEEGGFKFNWDWERMNFDEIPPENFNSIGGELA